MHLDITAFYLSGNRCCHIGKFYLIIVIQLCRIIIDLRILRLSLRLFKGHACNVACRKQCLLSGKVRVGIA